MSDVRLREERVSWRIAAAGVVVAVIGVAVLYITSFESLWRIHPIRQHVLDKVGDLIFVTGLLSLLWELIGKRVFLEEILAKTRVAQEIQAAGILNVTPNFRAGINWQELFKKTRHLDILVSYARTWRNNNLESLRALASHDDARIRLLLPDPEDATAIAALAQRYSTDPEDVRRRIQETIDAFLALGPEARATIEIWLLKAPPVYTMYCFDSVAVLSIYNHQVDRSPVPALTVEEGGELYRFVRDDFEKLLRDPRVRRIHPLP